MHTPAHTPPETAPQERAGRDGPAAQESEHWAYLDHNTLTRRWRSVCRTCTYRGPWRAGPDAATRATEDGLRHARTNREPPEWRT
jgi:hypothetical protein